MLIMFCLRDIIKNLNRLLPAKTRLQHASNVIHHAEQAQSACERMFTRVDRAANATHKQALYPFTDNALLTFGLRLPARFKYHNAQSKYLFKQMVHDMLGRNIMDNPKMGFESPNWLWLSQSCKSLLDETP